MEGTSAGELIPELMRQAFQDLIDLEVAAALGAERHERSDSRLGYRNGHRPRVLTTQVGDLTLQIPKLREGSFFPSALEPRRRIDKALYAVVMEAWVDGVSTRKVDHLVAALGSVEGISKSQVSRICQGLDEQVQAFLHRPLDHARFAYVFLDATYLHGRLGKQLQVVSRAAVIAVGVTEHGHREVLGLKVGDSESEPFWRAFIADLKERGLSGAKLVISDAHVGLTAAIGRMFQGCSWQRCRVHFARNLLATVPKTSQDMVVAALRSVFSQPSKETIVEQWDQVMGMLTSQFPAAARLMAEAREDVLAFRHFPREHWRQIWSTNPLERLNKEVKRRSNVVGIFPNDASIIRLVGALLQEQHEEWHLDHRRYFSEASMRKIEWHDDHAAGAIAPATPPAIPVAV